jgi:hypothetical protein
VLLRVSALPAGAARRPGPAGAARLRTPRFRRLGGRIPERAGSLPAAATVGAAFGTCSSWAAAGCTAVCASIDRAFFRSAYDARHVLQDLAHRARQATSRRTWRADRRPVCTALLPARCPCSWSASQARWSAHRRGRRPRGAGDGRSRAGRAGRARPPVDISKAARLAAARALAAAALVPGPIYARDGRLSGIVSLGVRLSKALLARGPVPARVRGQPGRPHAGQPLPGRADGRAAGRRAAGGARGAGPARAAPAAAAGAPASGDGSSTRGAASRPAR